MSIAVTGDYAEVRLFILNNTCLCTLQQTGNPNTNYSQLHLQPQAFL